MAKIKKEALVEELITSNTGWSEEERDWLMEQPIDRLQRMLNPVTKNKSNLTEGSGKGPGEGAVDMEEESGNCDEGMTSKTLGKRKKKAAMNEEDDSDEDATENDEGEEYEDDDTVENDEGEEESEVVSTQKRHGVVNDEGEDMEAFIEAAPKGMRDMLREGVTALNMEKQRLISAITSNSRCRFTKNQLREKPMKELRQLALLATNDENYEGAQGETPTDNSGEEEGLPLPVMNFEKKERESERKNRRAS